LTVSYRGWCLDAPILENSSGRGCGLHDPARPEAEVQDIDARRFHAERREGGAGPRSFGSRRRKVHIPAAGNEAICSSTSQRGFGPAREDELEAAGLALHRVDLGKAIA
jgi:hypothetical protein